MNKARILVVGVVMISALWIGVSIFNRYLGKSKAAGIQATFVMSADLQELYIGANGVVNVVIKPADDGTLSRKISGLDLVFKTEGGVQMTEIQAPKPYPPTSGVAVQSNMIQSEVTPNLAHVSYVFINPTLSLPSAVQFQIAFKGVSGGKARIYLDPAESQVVGNIEGSAYDLGAGAEANVFLKGTTSGLTVPVQMDTLRIVASPDQTVPFSLTIGPPAADKRISGFTLDLLYNSNDFALLDLSDPMELTPSGVEVASRFNPLKKDTTIPGVITLSYVAVLPEAQLPLNAIFHIKLQAKRIAKGEFSMRGQITGNIPENEYSINPSMAVYTIDQISTPTPAFPTPTNTTGGLTPPPGELTPTLAISGIPIITLNHIQDQISNNTITNRADVELVIEKNGFDPTDTGNRSQMLLSRTKNYTGSTWEQFSALRPWTFDAGDGQKFIFAQFKKSTGEIVEGVYTFILDTTPPTATMNLTVNYVSATLMSVTIHTKNIVDTAGIDSMRVSRLPDFSDNPAWEPFTFDKQYSFPSVPRSSGNSPDINNSFTLYVQYRDRVGNISPIYKDTVTWGTVITTPIVVLRPPIGSCMEYNSARGTTPVRWSWIGYDTVLLQVYDETNNWWTNRWVSGNSYIVDSKDGAVQIPAIPPGRDVYARYSPDGNTFSALGKVRCGGGTLPTFTPAPTIINDSCDCGQDNLCGGFCHFDKYGDVQYAPRVKCAIPSEKDRFTSAPSAAQRNAWCQRPLRTKGDINGDGIVDSQDYASYIRIVNGSKVNPNFIPDVNGDGVVSPEDRDIVVRTLRSSF